MKTEKGFSVNSKNSFTSSPPIALFRPLFPSLSIFLLAVSLVTSPCGCNDVGGQVKVEVEIDEELPIGSVVVNLLDHVMRLEGFDRSVASGFTFVLVPRNKIHDSLFQLAEAFEEENGSDPVQRGNGILKVKSRIDREALCRRRDFCEVKLEVEVTKARSRAAGSSQARTKRDLKVKEAEADVEGPRQKVWRETRASPCRGCSPVQGVNQGRVQSEIDAVVNDDVGARESHPRHVTQGDGRVIDASNQQRHNNDNNDNNDNNNNTNNNNNSSSTTSRHGENEAANNPKRSEHVVKASSPFAPSAGIEEGASPKSRSARDYFFQIIEVLVIVRDVNDNPPQFVLDESDPSLAQTDKWENETVLSFTVHVAENSPPGHGFALPCYVEDPDPSDDDLETPVTFEHSGNCSDLIRFSVRTEAEHFSRRGKRSKEADHSATLIPHDNNNDNNNNNDGNHHHHHHHHQRHHHHHHHHHHLKRAKRHQGSSASLWLTVVKELDREVIDRCHIIVRAKDSAGNSGKSLRMEVRVTDVNDNRPLFESDSVRLEIPEDTPPSLSEPIMKVEATDLDVGENGRIVYSFARSTQNSMGWLFHIDSDSGKIFLKSKMNGIEASSVLTSMAEGTTAEEEEEEEEKAFRLRVVASNPVPGSATSQAEVVIVPRDVNDHSPSVRVSPDPVEVFEEAEEEVEAVIGHVMVDDPDSGENGRTACAFYKNSSRSGDRLPLEDRFHGDDDDDDDDDGGGGNDLLRLVKVSRKIYKIVTRRRFDREKQAKHSLTLLCWDEGTPRMSTSREVVVVVRDVNDNRPTFRQEFYEVEVNENNPVGVAILKVTADDMDEGANAKVIYDIVARLPNVETAQTNDNDDNDDDDDEDQRHIRSTFSIDPDSGIVYATKSFDFESLRRYRFYVVASDRDFQSGCHDDCSFAAVTVDVIDVNDEPPLFSSEKYEFFVVENGAPETEVGLVAVSDADASPEFTKFNLTVESSFPPPTSGGSFFHLDEETGRLLTSRTLDREQYAVHHLWLVARNSAGPHPSSTCHVIVHVTDTNDNAPLVEYPTPGERSVQVRCAASQGTVLARIRARDADAGENASLEYSVAKGNEAGIVAVETKSGLVTLARPPLDLLEHKMAAERRGAKRTSEVLASNGTRGVEVKFEVVFVIRDRGEPPKSAETRLEVIVNCSLVELQRGQLEGSSKSDDLLTFLVDSSGLKTESFKRILNGEVVFATFGAIATAVLASCALLVCLGVRRNSRRAGADHTRNNSKNRLDDNNGGDGDGLKSNKMQSLACAAENHYQVVPGRKRGSTTRESEVKEDNLRNELLLMNRNNNKTDDPQPSKVPGNDFNAPWQTLEKRGRDDAVNRFSPPLKSDRGSQPIMDDLQPTTPATTSGFSTFLSTTAPPHSNCSPEAKQSQCNLFSHPQHQHQQQQQQQPQHHLHQQQQHLLQQQQQQQFNYQGGNTFQKNQLRPSFKLMRQEMTFTEAEKRKESLASASEVTRLLDILKSSHDNPGHYPSSDWPPIEDFNQSDIIWGQCVDDVIDDYDICHPEYEKL